MLSHILWHSVPSIQFSPWTVLIEQFHLMYQSNRRFNIPSRATPPPPGIWIIGKFLFKFPPSPGRKAVQMPPPSGKLLDYCFNLSEASIMLLKLCMCKHGLLDNMPYMPQDSGHTVFHVNTSSQHCRWTLHHYCTSQEAAKIILIWTEFIVGFTLYVSWNIWGIDDSIYYEDFVKEVMV